MSLSKEDLQAIRTIVREEVKDEVEQQLTDGFNSFEEKMKAKFSAQKLYADSIKEELLGHIDGLAVMMHSTLNSHDKRIVANTNAIHGVKDFLKMQ